MVKSFSCKETEKLYHGIRTKKWDSRIVERATVKLDQLAAAESLDDLRIPPSNRLEALKGDQFGQHSIRINQKWRFCFIWSEGADSVEIVDYH